MTTRATNSGSVVGLVLLAAAIGTATEADAGHVDLSDIETRLRSISTDAKGALAASRSNAIAAGIAAGAIAIASAYLHGRRRGRRRATVLEVRRVP